MGEEMTQEQFILQIEQDAYDGYANAQPGSKEEAIHHNRMMQIAKMINELDEKKAQRAHEKEMLMLKRRYEEERQKAEERSKNTDRIIHVAEIAAGTGASIYGAKKMEKMFKTVNEFEKTDIFTSESSKHLIKYIISKDGLMGTITKLIRR